MTKRGLIACAVLVLAMLAAYLRVSMSLGTEIDTPLRADAGDYVTYATNLVNHGVYSAERALAGGDHALAPKPDAFRNPGYPLMLTLFLRDEITVDRFVLDVSMVQALIGSVTVLLVFLLARMLVGQAMALLPAALTALSPHQIAFTTMILTETVYTALVVIFALLLVRAVHRREGPAVRWFWAGLALGLTVLVRPTLMHLPLLLVVICIASMPWRRSTMVVAWMVLGYGLAVGPWFVRNMVSTGEVADDRLTIAALHHGSYPDFRFEDRPETQDFPYRADPASPRITQSTASVVAHIVDQFEARPWAMVRWYLVGKPVAFFSWNVGQSADALMQYPALRNPFTDRSDFAAIASLMRLLHWPLVTLAFATTVGYLIFRQPSNGHVPTSPVRWLGFVVLFALAVHVVGAPFGRYSVPFMPIIFVLATVGTVETMRRFVMPTRA